MKNTKSASCAKASHYAKLKELLASLQPSQKATYHDYEFLKGVTFWAVRHTPTGHVVIKEKQDHRKAFFSCRNWVKNNYTPK